MANQLGTLHDNVIDAVFASKPAPGQVDVWMTRLSPALGLRSADYASVLDLGEIARWRRFRAPEAALQFLVGRALIRTTLSRYVPVAPAAWQFRMGPYGRPAISDPSGTGLAFNLSHVDDLVVCAVSVGDQVGVDVEKLQPQLDVMTLGRHTLAPSEMAALQKATPLERQELFFAFWTLKEAYIKARGLGISLPLDSFAFDFSGSSTGITFTDACLDDPSSWSFYRGQPTDEHRIALAVPRAGGVDVACHWTNPLGCSKGLDQQADLISSEL